MMLQLIDKKKIYLYLILLTILISIHNVNFIETFNKIFIVDKINIKSNINKITNDRIYKSLNYFYDLNIFSINPDEISKILNKFNIIGEYKVKKKYPSEILIELKETNILAYFFNNNERTYLGENGKEIKNIELTDIDIPLIIGKVNTSNFLELRKKLIDKGFEFDNFKKFYAFKSNRWDLLYKNKILIKLPIDDLENSLNKLKDIIEQTNIKNIKIIDLRVKNKIILS